MSCVCQRALRVQHGVRSFSTSTRRAVSLGLGANDREVVADVVPAYPPGPTRWYKQAASGLYGGQMIRFGNNTAEEYRTRFRRSWSVNVKAKKLYSKALGRDVKIRVTTRVLRTIDKLGGLDEYLLGEKAARVKELGEAGWWLRWAIMQTDTVQERFRKERQALGLPAITQASTEEQPPLSNEAAQELDANEVLDGLQENKTQLRFRVNKFKYVKLEGSQWVDTESRREHYIAILRKHSPTATLKAWEEDAHQRALTGMAPLADQIKTEWFQARQKFYEATLAAYKQIDGAEEVTEEDRQLHYPSSLEEFRSAEINASQVAEANKAARVRNEPIIAARRAAREEVRREKEFRRGEREDKRSKRVEQVEERRKAEVQREKADATQR